MKKYMILAAVAALTLASCAKVETTTTRTMDEEIPIGFSNYTPRSITKAGGSFTNTATLPDGAVIGVYGYSTDFNDYFRGVAEEHPAFITNGKVEFGTSGGDSPTATTGEKHYWPKDIRNLLTFYAYYPWVSAANSVITVLPSATSEGLGTFQVTQTADVTTMVDFMISDVENDMYYWDGTNASTNDHGRKSTIASTTYGIVPLQLRHMMSNVNFYFKTNDSEGSTITVKSATITGIKSRGTFTPSYTVPTTAGNKGTTTFDARGVESSEYTAALVIPIGSKYDADLNNVEENHNDIVLSETAAINYVDVEGTTAKNNFLFVPQELTDDAVVTITYDLKQGTTTTENVAEVKIKGALNNAQNPIVEWVYNNKYNYTFTIGLHEIYFTSQPVAWEDGQAGNITVN